MSCRFKVSGLSVGYAGRVLIEDVSFEVGPGECVLLCGANGIGKSTLLRIVAGQEMPLSGNAGFDEAGHIATLIPARVPKVQGFTVMQFVEASCFRRTDWLGRLTPEQESHICGTLEKLGIGGLSDRDISTLSDGEFQKAVIASAIAQESDLVLLDEPTAFLDVDSRVEILSLLRDVACDKAVIFSSHDIYEASRYCTRAFGVARQDGSAMGAEPLSKGGSANEAMASPKNIPARFIDSGKNAAPDAVKGVISQCFRNVL